MAGMSGVRELIESNLELACRNLVVPRSQCRSLSPAQANVAFGVWRPVRPKPCRVIAQELCNAVGDIDYNKINAAMARSENSACTTLLRPKLQSFGKSHASSDLTCTPSDNCERRLFEGRPVDIEPNAGGIGDRHRAVDNRQVETRP
jgi:hypothetical protein